MIRNNEQTHRSARTVHAIQIRLQGMTDRSVIVWPKHITDTTSARMINSRRTWITARRGDAVLLTRDGSTERQFVESAWAWLDEVKSDP